MKFYRRDIKMRNNIIQNAISLWKAGEMRELGKISSVFRVPDSEFRKQNKR
jgi:hypothetical protein